MTGRAMDETQVNSTCRAKHKLPPLAVVPILPHVPSHTPTITCGELWSKRTKDPVAQARRAVIFR